MSLSQKKGLKHFSYLCSRNGNPINVHPCIDTCHKFTLSPNNLIFKLIMFVEKTRHLHSMVEIKTLKICKNSVQLSNPTSLLNPKLVITHSPTRCWPKNSLPPPPFASNPRMGQILTNAFLITSLVSPPPSVSSSRAVEFPSTRFPFPLPFLLRMQVGFPSIQFPLPLPSLLHTWVKFPLTSLISF